MNNVGAVTRIGQTSVLSLRQVDNGTSRNRNREINGNCEQIKNVQHCPQNGDKFSEMQLGC